MKSKIIILTGPDKAGKSTLCANLIKVHPELTYIKGVRPTSYEETMERVTKLLETIKNSSNPFIFDRFHYPDELIYSDFNRDNPLPSNVRDWYLNTVVPELKSIGTSFVYCYADVDVLVKRFLASGETDIKAEWLAGLRSRYDQWAVTELDLCCLTLDSTRMSETDMLDATYAYLNPIYEL